MLANGRHHCRRLQHAWRKYDGDLKFSVLLVCAKDDTTLFEQRAIDVIKPRYNLAQNAMNRAGVKWTAEQRARQKERMNRPDTIAKFRAAALARPPISDEHRAKLSAVLNSPETRARQRAATLGKKLSAEHRAKLSAQRAGKPHKRCNATAETRAKMSATHTARLAFVKATPEVKAQRYADWNRRRREHALIDRAIASGRI